ncbi:MAG: hypothetical protein WB526_06315, partial [Candidatus Cybelea sp.]
WKPVNVPTSLPFGNEKIYTKPALPLTYNKFCDLASGKTQDTRGLSRSKRATASLPPVERMVSRAGSSEVHAGSSSATHAANT